MSKIDTYLKSLELKNNIQESKILYLDEAEIFCKRNENILGNLPSNGQLEQMKLKDKWESLMEYIIDQSKKSTNKKWRTKINYEDRNREDDMFYEFLIKRIFNLSEKEEDPEKLKLTIKYFIEYLVNCIKMNRR